MRVTGSILFLWKSYEFKIQLSTMGTHKRGPPLVSFVLFFFSNANGYGMGFSTVSFLFVEIYPLSLKHKKRGRIEPKFNVGATWY
jgi:hypothetical protein